MPAPTPDYSPEPCLDGQCFSPTACSGFGYCRERNMKGDMPSPATEPEAFEQFKAQCQANARKRVGAFIEHQQSLGRY